MSAFEPMSEREYRRIVNRQYRMPEMLASTEAKLARLRAEARSYGMHELLDDPDALNDAWERTVKRARIEGGEL